MRMSKSSIIGGVASSGSALAIALLPTRAVSAIRIADTA
ncbi:hypothetical protein I551_3774 [Mycobacterium ulcerans str. Harvey]|uniref:Uncharacterized protein n=1 Tax=Mycobacterium ulcerans str. Harvey TaxID=1299332 RepID=A0ABP3AIU1_MYCUL|nr:hypothetical protein I551_3774 [Mycobacterium ulcerans str. Harvey]